MRVSAHCLQRNDGTNEHFARLLGARDSRGQLAGARLTEDMIKKPEVRLE